MKQVKRVVLFGIDGAGTFFQQANTPNMDRIFAAGAVCRRVVTEVPSISAQCWGSMLHGVECGWHGLTNALVGQARYPVDSPYPSVFRVVREAMPQAKLASFCDWDPINYGIIEEGLDVYKYHAPDHALVEPAIEYIENNDFTLLFFHFDSVDGAGHRFGYGTPEHLAAIGRNDGYIGRIVKALEKRGWLEDTLILVEADHGGTPNYGYGGQHGGATEAEMYVSFFAAGGNVCPGELKDMLVRDTAAIILHALGIAQPASWNARVPRGLFPDCREEKKRPQGLVPRQQRLTRASLPEQGGFGEEFDDLKPMLYLPFEEENPGVTVHGKVYRVPGVMGGAMGFEDGFLTVEGVDLGGSYSMLFWVKPDSTVAHESCVVAAAGASCRSDDFAEGMSVEVADRYVRLRQKGPIGEMPVHLDMTCPADNREKWTHVAVTVDRENRRFGISVNMEPFPWWDIPENMDLTEGGRLYIGQDVLEHSGKRLRAALDDFCICRKALADKDLPRLKKYYCL